MAISDVIQEYDEDAQAIHSFCEELYDNMFGESFKRVRDMYQRMQSEVRPISDEELEYILVMFPMELVAVAESLNKLRLDHEVVKLKNRDKLEELRDKLKSEVSSIELTKTEKQDYINHKLSQKMVEYEILLSAYASVITRVENEQSFSRELIMGAKKIWDSRRGAESANPVSPVNIEEELPEYSRNTPQSYIK